MAKVTHVFKSHKRIQNGKVVSHDFVPRQAILDYDWSGRNLVISIIPTLSPMSATLVRDSGNVLYYRGVDPDYKFEVETWPDNNTIKRLSVIRVDRHLEIQYLSDHQDAI